LKSKEEAGRAFGCSSAAGETSLPRSRRTARDVQPTVMSDRIMVDFVDFAAISFEHDRVCHVSVRAFLV